MILGHECGGIIDSVGEGVNDQLIGKHVSIIPLIPCFKCAECQRGLFSACNNYSFIGSRQPGCYADYLELPQTNVLVVPDELSFDQVALIEPSTVARHMLVLGDFKAGQTAAVFGAGSIGLMAVQWLRILKAKLIICIDISDKNLEAARKLGAHITINPLRDDVVVEVYKHANVGVDISLEAAGVPQTLEQTVHITRPRGKIICAGNQPVEKSLPLSFIENLMRRELSLIGNHMSYSEPFPGSEWTDTVAALRDGGLDMETMISHHFSLAEAPDVFAKIGNAALSYRKIMLHPEETAR
jgi:L-iditol 2-dehydrogenase